MLNKLTVIMLFITLKTAYSAQFKLAIVGDDFATGAGAHPAYSYDSEVLWNLFTDIKQLNPSLQTLIEANIITRNKSLISPVRALPTFREFSGGLEALIQYSIFSLTKRYFDVEEYSFGYFLAGKLGIDATSTIIAANVGARTADISKQIDRVLAMNNEFLPELLVVMFAANDLCSARIEMTLSSEAYETILNSGLKYILNKVKPNSNLNHKIYIPSYLSVMQLLNADKVLAKKIYAHGEDTTCKKLSNNNFMPTQDQTKKVAASDLESLKKSIFQQILPINPVTFCPTLFSKAKDKRAFEKRIGTLANRIKSFRKKQIKIIDELNIKSNLEKKNVEFIYVQDTSSIIFDSEDVATDCFHLGIKGQNKLATKIFNSIN